MTLQQPAFDPGNTKHPSTKAIILRFFKAITRSTKNQGDQATRSFWAYTEENGKTDPTSFNGLM
jgi:hypothetical protein